MGQTDAARKGGGGISDGLLLSLFGLLLCLTVLVWTATGLSGLFAHGSWPDGVAFTGTPPALRSLATAPTDLPAAWPAAPPTQLSGYGLFWGLLIGEAMILMVLAIFALGTVTRWRAVRAHRRTGTYGTPVREPAPNPRKPVRENPEAVREDPEPVRDERPHPARNAVRDHASPHPASDPPTPTPASTDPPTTEPTLPPPTTPEHTREAVPTPLSPVRETPRPSLSPTEPQIPPQPGPAAPGHPAPGSPAPVGDGTLFGPPDVRRPAAVQAVRDAEGPVLVVTSDPAVWSDTKDARGKLGPVLVYDPGHLCDTPGRLHWSPAEGCGDPETAQARAAALLAPVRPHSRLDAATADTAETLLRCWLHAAAVDGRPFRQVHRWAQGSDAHEPVRILRSHPKAVSGLAGLLESALTAHPESRRLAQELTARAFSAFSTVHIREACTPNRTDSLALASFLSEGGTLYVVGESIEDPRTHPGAMPLLTALAASVVERGRRMAARSSDGRLDPPLTLVLDDVAAVAPFPALPALLAEGSTRGLPTLALMRSREQARTRWPNDALVPRA
ncbi:type IV secretory system conjugative DNA transfer family protein [Streptomyces sp. cmx-4-25]|uniref:type IV secretory system conjugative DNA transfer family protein n=1 Tax=Streptomyces sp. cmx-4-25 TaxID=2790933 RepID=UPI003980B506